MHDTRANKMEEGRVTIQAKKRSIHDDTHIWGKTDPTFGGNPTAILTEALQKQVGYPIRSVHSERFWFLPWAARAPPRQIPSRTQKPKDGENRIC